MRSTLPVASAGSTMRTSASFLAPSLQAKAVAGAAADAASAGMQVDGDGKREGLQSMLRSLGRRPGSRARGRSRDRAWGRSAAARRGPSRRCRGAEESLRQLVSRARGRRADGQAGATPPSCCSSSKSSTRRRSVAFPKNFELPPTLVIGRRIELLAVAVAPGFFVA